MKNLSDRLKKVEILEQEYCLAVSNNVIDGIEEIVGDVKKLPKNFSLTFRQSKDIILLLMNEGVKLQNFINKTKEPLLDMEEIDIILGYANEEEIENLNKAINELLEQLNK